MSESGSLKLNVLFFGATAEATGTRSRTIEVPIGSTSFEVLNHLISVYPKLRSHNLLYSLNQAYANGRERVSEDDELAVFTAVSGG